MGGNGARTGRSAAAIDYGEIEVAGIEVTTDGTTVTLTGTVHSQQERDRGLARARETEGVTKVVDRLTVR